MASALLDPKVTVGTQPDSAALSANGARLYAANFGGGTVSVIDTATNAVTKTVTVGTRPTGVVEVNGSVYVANLSSSSVSVFDPTLAVPVVSSFAVPATGSSLSAPSGLAASSNGQRLYVNDARNGKTFVFDLTQNPPVSTANVVNGTDTFPAYLAVSGTTGYSANPGSNSIRVLDLTALTATNVPVGGSPYGVVPTTSTMPTQLAETGTSRCTSRTPAVGRRTIGGPNAVDGNTFKNLARLAVLAGVVQIDAAGGDGSTPAGGQINGTIQNNTISNVAGFINGRRAIDIPGRSGLA